MPESPLILRTTAEAARSDFAAAHPGGRATNQALIQAYFATLIAILQASPPKLPTSESNSLSRKAF